MDVFPSVNQFKSDPAAGALLRDLYHEMGDGSNVYLELETTTFECGYGRVMLQIPLHLWEHLRSVPVAEYDLADLDDEQITKKAEECVAHRIAESEEEKREDPLNSPASDFLCSRCDRPAAEQVAERAEDYRRQRAFQRELRAKVEELSKRKRA